MRIFGHKPSEIRKAIAGFAASLLVLLVALPLAGLPASVVVIVGSVTSIVTGVSIYLSKANVAAVIDSLDKVDYTFPPVRDGGP